MRAGPILGWNNRFLWLGGLGLLLFGLLVFGIAPANHHLDSGSTWSHYPDGYSAWYAQMAERGTPIIRWQRPIPDLVDQLKADAADRANTDPTVTSTLVVILPQALPFEQVFETYPDLQAWVQAGHRMILLGIKESVTAAPFSSQIPSSVGAVRVDTRRRGPHHHPPDNWFLADEWGTLVWRMPETAATLIVGVPTYLGANAYQDKGSNLAFLTHLATAEEGVIWVDEYLHGYRDRDTGTATTRNDSWLDYLARTPLLILVIQGATVGLLAILAHNRRLGRLQSIQPPPQDNSRAYITALAGVLHKAESYDFVVQTLKEQEQQGLQRLLGLGKDPVSARTLSTAWADYSGQDPTQLESWLNAPIPQTESQTQDWLQRLQLIHHLTLTQPQSRRSGHE